MISTSVGEEAQLHFFSFIFNDEGFSFKVKTDTNGEGTSVEINRRYV